MRGFAAPLFAIPLACVLFATGCSNEAAETDELQQVDNPVAATAATSPPAATPAGTVLPAGDVDAMGVHERSRTLAAAVTEPPSLLLYSLDDPAAAPRSVPLPGPASAIDPIDGGLAVAVPTAGIIAKVSLPDGVVTPLKVDGTPSGTTVADGRTLVAAGNRKAVDVVDGDRVSRSITGQLYSADQVFAAGNRPVVLDRLRTAVFDVDLAEGKIGEGLRAGDGATNGVADDHGRLLVTDTRGGSLLAFSTDPLLLRQRYPAPGGPFGIAYDPARDLAWVTMTERNEVVGYEMTGGEPVERHRMPTVRQPDSVAVDPRTSNVLVGSAVGEGIQVIAP